MAAIFRVHRAVTLPDRNLFALAGVIHRGMVDVGMEAVLQGESSTEEFRERIHGVEHVVADPEKAPYPALTFEYGSQEELARWQRIQWSDRELNVAFPADAREDAP